MARFRRRRPRVLWLPVHGRDLSTAVEGNFSGNGIGGILSLPQDGTFDQDAQAVTFDYSNAASFEEGTDFRSLHELTSGNNYRLRRIVGKFHAAGLAENNAEVELPLIQLAAGFIINKTDDNGNIVTAIGSDVPAGPLHQDSAEDPWIWRRTWMLSPVTPYASFGSGAIVADNLAAQTAYGFQGIFPNTTAGYGSVQDGPHIDQKTARVIGPQERLIFWVQARVINAGTEVNRGSVPWNLDVRILASLRSNQGNRRNASR